MKIAIMGDNHLGYKWGDKELGMDSIRQAREAFVKAIRERVDFIVHAGDIFDSKVPKPEVWVEALRIFSLTFMVPDSGVKPANGDASGIHFRGIPVVAIHGNHERRGGGLKNPVETLNAAGHVIYLHNNEIRLEKDEEIVRVFGIGYVPESYALEALKAANPVKDEGCFNVFVFHQNVKEFLPDEVSFLSLADLPRFDLVVDGHIHWKVEKDLADGKFLIPGSTVITQLKRQEAERKKGFFIFDTKTGKSRFIELEEARPFVFEEMEFKDSEASSVISEVRGRLEELLSRNYPMKPIIKIKLTGSLKVGRNIDKDSLIKGFEDQAIIFLDNRMEAQEFKRRIEELREIHSRKLGNESLGIAILMRKLEEVKYSGPDIEDIFDSLVEGDTDNVLKQFISYYQHHSSN